MQGYVLWWFSDFEPLYIYILVHKKSYLIFSSAVLEPDVVVKRQEALAAARLRMQEDLNAQVEKHKEKLRQVWTGLT